MTKVTNAAGWTFDLAAKTLAWPEAGLDPAPLPDVSIASLVYFGANYLTSQAASRTVSDGFKKDWADAAEGRKAKDAPKDCVPASDSSQYVAAMVKARKDLFAKVLEGYEVGERASGLDPVGEELDKLARGWLQAFAGAMGWYTLPAKKKVARDADAYADPKGRYATFGDALAAFKVSQADSTKFTLAGPDKKPWPMKTKSGTSIADLMLAEARRRAEAAKSEKPTVTLAGDSEDVEF